MNQCENKCKITLGRIIQNARREHGLSQRDLCQMIAEKFSVIIDWGELGKIENCRVEVRDCGYDWLTQALSEIFDVDADWLEQIRQQTELEPFVLDMSKAIFSIYMRRNGNENN